MDNIYCKIYIHSLIKKGKAYASYEFFKKILLNLKTKIKGVEPLILFFNNIKKISPIVNFSRLTLGVLNLMFQ